MFIVFFTRGTASSDARSPFFVVLSQAFCGYLCVMISLKSSFRSKEFSCNVPDISFSITHDRAKVKVSASKSSQPDYVFNEYLYPDESKTICLSDIDRLIDLRAQKWLVFSLSVVIEEEQALSDGEYKTINTKQLSTEVISCRANILNMTASDFCSKHFLTLINGSKMTVPGCLEYLTYTGTDSCSCSAVYDDGTTRNFNVSRIGGDSYYSTVDVSPNNFYDSSRLLISYVVSAGSRSQTFEIDLDATPDMAPALLFFNSFGVQELAYCQGEHRQVSSFDRKQARIGRLKTTYKTEEKESFKADTGILTFPMFEWWREVLRSENIRVLPISNGGVIAGEGLPVVISSEKVEVSNAADHLPRITFEYEYADRNHNIFSLRREGRIFDNTFDYTFN